jgi:hypothetical protein
MNFILEELLSPVVLARPAPDVLAIAVCPGAVKDSRSNGPHYDAKHKEANCKEGIVDSCLLSSLVTASPVGPEDEYREGERDASDDK